jgi:hypothetical protein
LLKLFHAHFFAAFAFIDLFNDVPEDLDLFLFGFKHLLDFTRPSLVEDHHIRVRKAGTISHPFWRAFEAQVAKVVIAHCPLLQGHL